MVNMDEIRKKFDIHEIAKNKLAEIEKYKCKTIEYNPIMNPMLRR